MEKNNNPKVALVITQKKNLQTIEYENQVDRIALIQWAVLIDKDPETQIDVREYDDLDDLVEVVCNALGTEPNRQIRSKIFNTWLKYCPNPTIVTDDYLKQDLSIEQLCNLSDEQVERRKALLGITRIVQVIRKRKGTYVFKVINS